MLYPIELHPPISNPASRSEVHYRTRAEADRQVCAGRDLILAGNLSSIPTPDVRARFAFRGTAREDLKGPMAHSRTAKKAVRQNISHRAVNRWRLATLREALKELQEKILHGTNDEARAEFRKVAQILDRTAQKGVIHKNTAARRKSRLNARVKAKVLGKTA
jgi:small subunit ribosomal protein S20